MARNAITTLAVACLAASTAGASSDFFNGITVNGSVSLHKDITLNACSLYGRGGVSAHKNVALQNGAMVGALSSSTVSGFGGTFVVSADTTAHLASDVESMIDSIEAGNNLPGNITDVEVVASLPDTLERGTAYVVNGDVSFEKDYHVEDVLIAARGDVRWGKDGSFTNSAELDSGGFATGLLATGSVSIMMDGHIDGAMVVAGGNVTFNKDFFSTSLCMQIGGDLMIKKDTTISGLDGLEPLFPRYKTLNVPTPTGLYD